MNHTIAIIVPSFNGGEPFKCCLSSLKNLNEKITVVDSGSTDASVGTARGMGANVIEINQSDFNHGFTRDIARKAVGGDIVVFLTQDAVVTTENSIEKLVAPIVFGDAEICYGRQLPRPGASFFECFPRDFNYPADSHVRSMESVGEFGAFTFFCSNAFAAYSQKALDEVGGFQPTLTHEDYFTVAKVLKNGGRIAYVAEAEVVHSHSYTLWQEFQRYFDAGYVRAVNPWVTDLVGQAENHGSRFFKTLVRRLAKEDPKLIPYAVVQSMFKWLGYRMGYLCFGGPTWLKKMLSGQPYYFDSKYYVPGKN